MSVETVSSLDDLLARCTVANEQNLSQSATIQPEQIATCLGLSFACDTTNCELNNLLPIYTHLLKDLRENPETSPFVRILNSSNRHHAPVDASIALLYFIEFPSMVQKTRASVSNLAECNVNEKFNCSDLVYEIAKNTTLLNWCRGALASSEEQHAVVLASCINILDSINCVEKSHARKYIKSHLLRLKRGCSHEEIVEGFRLLRSDLASVVSRDDVLRDASVNAILFQMHTLVTLFGDDKAMHIMQASQNKEAFEAGLSKHRTSFSEEEYQMFRFMLMSENQSLAEQFSSTQAVRSKKPLGEFNACARSGCSNEGTKRCDSCKIAQYCSRECQVADWRARHKQMCKKVTLPKEASSKAIKSARSIASPALRNQDEFLQEHPQFDYRIVLPTGTQDCGVIFAHPMGKFMFKMWRQKAPESPYVFRMYELLVENHPDKEQIIRKQLSDEYGVDPVSENARQTTTITH